MIRREFQCPDCGGSDAYRSRRRNVVEKYFLPVLLLRPVRCAQCYRRSHVSLLVDVPERPVRTAIRRQAAA